jgi:hypothetical protein
MKKKIIGIFVCILLIAVLFPRFVIAEIEEEASDDSITTINCHIELDGTFVNAFHFRYRKIIGENKYSLRMSIIKFTDADISVNYGERNEHGSGKLFVYRYNGVYNHDYDNDTIAMNGKAWFLHIDMK